MSSLFLLTIMTFTWGIGGILVKKGYKNLTPWQTYAFDAIVIALPMWLLYGFWQSGKILPITPFAVFSALLISFVYALYYYAIYHGPIGLATPIIASYPIFTVILSFFLLQERLNLISYIGISATIIGIIIISLPEKLKLKLEKWVF
ncbi:DMT family transporter, partial [Candidatus Gottesmanbacteria bacterium]|nr:DMT family transporter [Candidatus Gottesmanbacteria bacterium]